MSSAQRESIWDFATADYEERMGLARQMKSRREALECTPSQLAVSAGVSELNLALFEQGVAFDGSHEVACDVVEAVHRLETLRAGKAILRLCKF